MATENYSVKTTRHWPAPTTRDSIRTLSHLADSVAFNIKHSLRHLHTSQEAYDLAVAGEPNSLEALAWNMQHTYKHMGEALEHAEKLVNHIGMRASLLEGHVKKGVLSGMRKNIHKVIDLIKEIIKLLEKSSDEVNNLLGNKEKIYDSIKVMHQKMYEIRELLHEVEHLLNQDDRVHDEKKLLAAANPMPDNPIEKKPTNEWLTEIEELLS